MPGRRMTKKGQRLQHIVHMKNEGVGKALTDELYGLIQGYENGDKNDKLLNTVFVLWSVEKG